MGIALGSTRLDAAPPEAAPPNTWRPSLDLTDLEPKRRATLAAAAAQEALGTRWHLVVLAGPDAGLVLPADGKQVIGRDGVLSDPLVSRRHLTIRARDKWLLVGEAGSANGTRWRAWAGLWLPLVKPRRMAEGARLKIGGSLLEVRRRPNNLAVPAPPAPQSHNWVLITSLLCAVLMVGMGVVAVRTGSRGAMGAVMMAPMALMATMRVIPLLQARFTAKNQGHVMARAKRGLNQPGWRWGQPDPPTMLLALAARAGEHSACQAQTPTAPEFAAASAYPAEPEFPTAPTLSRLSRAGTNRSNRRSPRAQAQNQDALRAWSDRTQRKRILALQDGDCLALTGPAAPDALAWWCAQVLARSAARLHLRPGGVELVWGSREREGSASLLHCPDDQVPAQALSIQQAPAEAPSCTPTWWQAACLLQGLDPFQNAAQLGASSAPDSVLLSQVVAELDPAELAEQWALSETLGRGCPDHLEAVLGVGSHGVVQADLVRHGPHALLAGTTGSGKSELLVAWLLQLALGCAPGRLSLVLVDYKGGAAFGPLMRLPHTAGVLTDLDPAATLRALSSLEAEVRRRERLLARYEAKDVAHLPAQVVVPRLVVAVDEFATMAAEHAEVLGALVRVAAQGRSLGIHLILSTQRPQGAISPAVRANTALRVCLRVLDPGDSRDVLGHEGAARLPVHPGRVIIEGVDCSAGGSAQAKQPLQAPWCGSDEQVEALVGRITAAAGNLPPPWRPWAPPLPTRVDVAEAQALVAGQHGAGHAQPENREAPSGQEHSRPQSAGADLPAGAGAGPLLALTDLPDQQRLGLWHWDLEPPLVVLGAPGSGRSTTLASIALQAARAGVGVHLCGAPKGVLRAHLEAPEAGDFLGTQVGPEDPRRLARLWSLAVSGALAGDLLCLDDVDALLPAVDEVLGPGEGHALLESIIRASSASGTHLLISAPLAAANTRWTSGIGLRLILGACTSAQASLAGLPHGMVTGRGAGRGLLLQAGQATACQVVLPGSTPARAIGRRPHPLRLEPLPRRVNATEVPPGTWALGGDEAAPVWLEPGTSVLVVGPAGSGRSTTLRALVRYVSALGLATTDLDGTNLEGIDLGGTCQDGTGLNSALNAQAQPAVPVEAPDPARDTAKVPVHEPVLVVDDLDRKDAATQACVEAALTRGVLVLATATTDKMAATYRGPLALLRERGAVVVLWPGIGPATQVAGVRLRPLTDPRALTLPGSGVLVHRGQSTPVQVVAPTTEK